MFTQKRTAEVQRAKIELKHGRLRLLTFVLAVPNQATSGQGKVTVNRNPMPATITVQDNRVIIELETETTLQASQAIEVELW